MSSNGQEEITNNRFLMNKERPPLVEVSNEGLIYLPSSLKLPLGQSVIINSPWKIFLREILSTQGSAQKDS